MKKQNFIWHLLENQNSLLGVSGIQYSPLIINFKIDSKKFFLFFDGNKNLSRKFVTKYISIGLVNQFYDRVIRDL